MMLKKIKDPDPPKIKMNPDSPKLTGLDHSSLVSVMCTDVDLQGACILVDPAALETVDLLALGVGEHVVSHVVLPLHPLVAHQTEEAQLGRGKEILPVGVSRNTYNTRKTGCSRGALFSLPWELVGHTYTAYGHPCI